MASREVNHSESGSRVGAAKRRPRILITRSRGQASQLAVALERLGAETILIPTIEIAALASFEVFDAALFTLARPKHEIDWLLFTSANAVHALGSRRSALALQLYPKHVAAIGPATAKAIEYLRLTPGNGPILLPPHYVAESLAETLLAVAGPMPRHFMVIRAEAARDVIPEALSAAGHQISIVPAYRNITPADTLPALARIFAAPESYPDVITFTSSSTARNLFELLESAGIDLPHGIVLASIGPITSATLRELGYEPTIEATEPTIDSLVAAISRYLELSQTCNTSDD